MCLLYGEQHKQTIVEFFAKNPKINVLIKNIIAQQGNPYFVGGFVRDLILTNSVEGIDIDIEVHNMSLESLANCLSMHGLVDYVGKVFGVLKIHEMDIDWSIPRIDSSGRKPHTIFEKNLSIKEALARRDLTMNAMAIDIKTLQLHDPFDGLEDMNKKILRAPDVDFFQEDPLRLYRVMQFIGRFSMCPDDSLQTICHTMDVSMVSVERVEQEFKKLFLKSIHPSKGIRWLQSVGKLILFPELERLIRINQNPKWHPEGSVFEHTMQAIDAAAINSYADNNEKLLLIYAALCHDLGKYDSTEIDEQGVIHSRGHEDDGIPHVRSLMKRITCSKKIIQKVEKLVLYHMTPGNFVQTNASTAAYKRLAYKLAPHVTMRQLGFLAYADIRGRSLHPFSERTVEVPEVEKFLQNAERYGVLDAPEAPLLSGKDLLSDISAGPLLGKAVEYAYKTQINESITDKKTLKARVIHHFICAEDPSFHR